MSLTHLGKAALIALMLLFVFQALPAQDRQIELSSQGSQMRLLQNSDLGFTANYRIGKLSIKESQTRGGVFDQLNIENYGHTTEIGEPQLPMQRQFIAVPVGAQVQLDVTHLSQRNLDASQSLLQNRVIPAQAPVSKSADPSTITFELKEEAYSAAGFRSRELFSVVDMGYLRGVRMFALDFYPVTYDPVANTLVVTEEASVEVRFSGANLAATADLLARTASVEYDALYNKVFFNWDADTRGNFMRHPTKYVILCPPAQAAQMQEFVDWKTQQGFQVILTTVGTGGTIANTSTAIKNYMQGLWNAATPSDPAPTYLLIVGDESGSIAIATNTGATDSHVTDQTYVRLNGSDYLPDMYWGRFSVSSNTELQNIINKTITFEKTAMTDLSYLGKTVLIAGVDGSWAPTHGNGAINYATSQYFNTAHGINSDNYLYPASGQSATTIRTKANEGRGYINYTAHGSETSWHDPSFTTSHVNAMTNYGKYGVMIGNCCITNWFNYGSPCFGESIIRKQNAGGVVYIGGINSTYWDEDYYWAVGYKRPINGSAPAYDANKLGAYDAMAHSHGEAYEDWAMTVGDQIYMGNLAVQQSGSSRTNYYWEIYHIMGDPSLMPYMGVPSVNTATFPNTILIGAPSINITAAPHSRVALTKDGVIHASAMVPANGTLTLPIIPFTTVGNARLVITAQNKITRIEDITVAPNAGPFVTVDALSYADNNNNTPEYNEAGRLNVTFKNVGNQTASNVTATLTCSTTGITITDNSETLASIGAGASIVRNNAFAFNIASNIPYGTVAMFTITMVSGSQTWEHSFTLEINVPLISFGDYTISDPSGNNNGNLDPGETATFSIIIKNTGNAESRQGYIWLSTLFPQLSISPSQMSFPAIPALGETSVDFTLTADSSINAGTLVTIIMEAGAGAYGLTRQVQLEIGAPDVVIIGSGTSTQPHPLNRYYTYSGHEAIYLASELVAPGSIKSLAYYKASGADQNPIEAVKIYMKNTTDATLATGNYSTNGYTLVFNGIFTNDNTSGWMEVDLDTRFNYDGTNLAILIEKGYQYWTSSYPNWTYTTSSTNRARQNQNDSAQPTSLTSTRNLPNMRLRVFPVQGFLYPPSDLTAIASNSRITLNWLAPISGNPTGYKIYRNNSLLTTVTTLTYTDTAVTNGTTYSYYVKAAYSNGDSNATETVTVTASNLAIIGTGNESTGSTLACPINVWYQSLHGQSVYTAAELTAAGIAGGTIITHLGFNVTDEPQRAMPNYVIRMGHTSATNSSAFVSTGLTTVWSATSYQPSSLGWDMLELSTPFVWNGTDNIVVDTAFGLIGNYNSSGTVQSTSMNYGYIYARSDTQDQTNVFTGSTHNLRPNLQIMFTPSEDLHIIVVQPTSLHYEEVAAGTTEVKQLTIRNVGTQNLTGTITSPPGYTLTVANRADATLNKQDGSERNTLFFGIPAGQEKEYNLTFAPTQATTYNGNVVISSNADNSPTTNIAVTGSGFIPPTISLSSSSISCTLDPDNEAIRTLTISNTGSRALEYSIAMEELVAAARGNQLMQADTDRSIAGSTLVVDATSFMPGTTVDWTFTVTNGSTDTEWLKYVYITVPTGVIVNSATNFVGGSGGEMSPNVTSGNGITIEWFGQSGNWGVIQGGQSATATVNVTISSFLSGSFNLMYTIDGDIYGAEPHTIDGSITLIQDSFPIDWVNALPINGSIAGGSSEQITLSFSSHGMAAGVYEALLTVSSNDPFNPSLDVDVSMTVTGHINQAPVFTPPDHLSFDKNSSLISNFGLWASDPDGDPLTLTCSGNSDISVDINGMMVTFSAPQNWVGQELMTFGVSDGTLTTYGDILVIVDPVAGPGWTPTVYPNNPATVFGVVTLDWVPANLNDVVGAFVGAECRGVADVTVSDGQAYVTLLVNLAAQNETVSFMLYNYADGNSYPITGTLSLGFGSVVGTSAPLPLNASTLISLDAPIINGYEMTATGMKLQWDAVPNADQYQIWRSTDPYSGFTLINTVSTTSFTDNYLGDRMFYHVKAITGGIAK
ncbi:MAG: gingipain R [Candidatus Cloacimonetes bacterium]|nr:gingipain R [Candidatus Cloacimonadota bacterium]